MAANTGSIALIAYRCHGRYYLDKTPFDGDYTNLRLPAIQGMLTDTDDYREWLTEKRAYFAALAATQDATIFCIDEPIAHVISRKQWPEAQRTKALLRVNTRMASSVIIVNLDAETLTLQYGAHLPLRSVAHSYPLWRLTPSAYSGYLTLSRDEKDRPYMAEPAVRRRAPEPLVAADGTTTVCVRPKTGLHSGRAVFLAHAMAKIYRTYYQAITRFGLEWDRGSFILHEFTFAVLSIAAGEVEFSSAICCRTFCYGREEDRCTSAHPYSQWLTLRDLGWVPFFGSFFHRKDQRAGAAPAEHLYWMKGVAVNVSIVVDGAAVREAVDWGRAQGKENFLIIVVSIYEVCFAEVHAGTDKQQQVIRFSDAMWLSPLRPEHCMSLHPLEQPQYSAEAGASTIPGEKIVGCNSFGTTARLERHYTGLAALVNFFKEATLRQLPRHGSSALPREILARIMTFTDVETQRRCMQLSRSLCAFGFSDFRIDGQWSIAATTTGVVRKKGSAQSNVQQGLLALHLAHEETGETATAVQVTSGNGMRRWDWVPLIGSGERRVLMPEVALAFAEEKEDYERDEDGANSDVSHLACDDLDN